MLLTPPPPGADGRLTVTWCNTRTSNTYLGWAVPDLDPHAEDTMFKHGSFIGTRSGSLYGLGQEVPSGGDLPIPEPGWIQEGDTVALSYDPAKGTMHFRLNGGTESLIFTGLRADLVPAVCLLREGDSCAIVVR